jgi:exopolysaccharide production protein ExoQ
LAQLALVLTVAFIVFALRQDVRQGQRFSMGTWISFLWIGVSATRPLVYWVHPGAFAAFGEMAAWEQGRIEIIKNNPLDRNVLIALMVLGLIILLGRRHRFRLMLSDNGWLVAFCALCLFSLLWSEEPGTALKRWIRLAGDVVVILLILTERDPEETIYRVLRRMAILFLPLSVLLIRFYDQLGRIYTLYGTQMWVGVADHKNSLGALCAFTGIVLVWQGLTRWPKMDWLNAGLVAMAGYLLLGSRSSTAAVVFVLGVLLLVVQSRIKKDVRKFNRAIITGLIVLLVLQVIAVFFLNKSLAPIFFSAAGRDSSLTGRVPLWQKLIEMGNRTPLLGRGFTSFWLNNERVTEVWRTFTDTPLTAHNGYIDIYLDLGLAGLLIFFFLLAQTYRNIMRSFDDNPKLAQLKIALFAMVFFHNFTESTFAKPFAFLWLLFLLSSIVVRAKPSVEGESHL